MNDISNISLNFNRFVNLNFAYAGPIVGAFVINATGALIATICVYIYINRQKFRKYKFLSIITRPFHGIIKKIAIKNIEKQTKDKK
tara:strand:+ start:228 stop:485 length:258 start_codon:yes stop_codon:yes gene_type:complete